MRQALLLLTFGLLVLIQAQANAQVVRFFSDSMTMDRLHGVPLLPAGFDSEKTSRPVSGTPMTASPSDIPMGMETTYPMETGPLCDAEKVAAAKKKFASAYKPVFYDNDFSYLCDPCYCGHWPGDNLKRICLLGGHGVLDIGGQYRFRHHNEHNFRGLGLTGNDDQFDLHRTRIFANLELGDSIRAYAEYIDAAEFNENGNARPIEVNRSDMLNLFVDAKLYEGCDSELWFRGGRQELIYGAQRAVSPLDWANTRRTFQGYKGMYKTGNWAIDGFWTNPIYANDVHFDSPNQQQQFFGTYATNKDWYGKTLELFYLGYLNETNPNDFEFHTVGSRIEGSMGALNYEGWGAYQFGSNTDGSSHNAGAFTFGLGHTWKDHCWKPALWAYYDWASGADELGAGNGYHHLFPLAHKYLGFMDLYGRRNIQSPNVRLSLSPTDKVTLMVWYYYMQLQNINDTPYSVVMTPFNPGNAPGSRELGHELDFTITYNRTPRDSVLVGYSHFFTGNYYRTTAGVPTSSDADFLYIQYQVNF